MSDVDIRMKQFHPDDIGRLRTLPCQAVIVSEGDEHLRHIPAVLKQNPQRDYENAGSALVQTLGAELSYPSQI